MADEQKKDEKDLLAPQIAENEEKELAPEELSETELEKVAGGVISPRDAASGLPTGQRMHKPF